MYTYLQKRAAASRHRDLCRLDLARGSQASQAGEGVRITIMMMIMMISGNDDDNDDGDEYGVQYWIMIMISICNSDQRNHVPKLLDWLAMKVFDVFLLDQAFLDLRTY